MRFRTNGRLEKVQQAIGNLVNAKKQRNSSYPLIHLMLILTRFNEHEVGQLAKYAELGVDKISITHVWVP